MNLAALFAKRIPFAVVALVMLHDSLIHIRGKSACLAQIFRTDLRMAPIDLLLFFAAVRLTSPHDVMIDKPLPNVMQQRRRCKLAQLIMRKPQPCADYHRKDAHMNGMVIDIIIITLDVHDIAHDVSIAYHIIDHRLHRFA